MKQIRHKNPLNRPDWDSFVVLCPQFRSSVNLSRIIRVAGCLGIKRIIACGNTKVDPKITRDSVEFVDLQRRRSLPPVIKSLKKNGLTIVGLEQTDHSHSIIDFQFPKNTALVLGHERLGIEESVLPLLDFAVEIPVFGQPHSFNVASAATIAMYEYCRQHH